MKKLLSCAATTFVLAGGLAVGGLGAATGAQADPGPFPTYHWCPGDYWDPAWGDNWEWGTCHDDHHRDIDADDHGRDFWDGGGPGPGGYAPRYHWCPGDFWDPAWGFNWEWGACHDDHHRDSDGGDHGRDFWG